MMRTDAYKLIGIERYDALMSRYLNFVKVVGDEKKNPVNVFTPLTESQLNELTLIREISKELQNKKEDDLKKAAEAAAAQPEETAVEEEKKEKEEEEEEEEKKSD